MLCEMLRYNEKENFCKLAGYNGKEGQYIILVKMHPDDHFPWFDVTVYKRDDQGNRIMPPVREFRLDRSLMDVCIFMIQHSRPGHNINMHNDEIRSRDVFDIVYLAEVDAEYFWDWENDD